MSIASRIEAIEQHLTDDYNVLEVAGADLTNVDKNIVNLKPTWKERLLYFMNNGTDEVWNNWDKVTGEGTSMTLNNTLEGKMSIILKGNTSQETTTGKNKLQYTLEDLKTNNTSGTWNNNVYTWNGITFTINDDLSITVNGTATAVSYIYVNLYNLGLISGTEYILNGCPSGGGVSTYSLRIYAGNSYSSDLGNGLSFTFNNQTIVRVNVSKGTTVNNLTFYPMIRLSSVSDSTYEKPTFGASPNPDYPQDVHVVSGDNEINITGKNLFSGDYSQFDSIGGEGTTYGYFKLPDDTNDYVLSVTAKNNFTATLSQYIGFSKKGGTATGGFVWVISGNSSYTKGQTYTALNRVSGTRLDYVSIYANNSATLEALVENFDIQLEKSSTATDYEPYKSAIYPVNLPVENILDITSSGSSIGGVPFTIENGIIKINGTTSSSTASYYFNTFRAKSESAVFSIEVTNYTDKSSGNSALILQQSDDGTTGWSTLSELSLNSVYAKQNSVTLDSSKYYRLRWYVDNNTFTNATIKVQLEYGNKKNSFTPYGTTPIELCKIGNYQDKFIRNSGKNLLDYSTCVIGDINGSTGQDEAQTMRIRSDFIKIEPSTSYVCSLVGGQYTTFFYTNDKTYIAGGGASWINSGTSFTTPNNAEYVRLKFWKGQNTAISLSDLKNVMFNIGSVALDYEPYGNGEWYVKKELKKHIISNTDIASISSYWYSTYGQYGATIDKTKLGISGVSDRASLCNIAIKINALRNIAEHTYIFNANAGALYFFSSTYDTVEHANEELVGAEIIYNLDIPEYTKITGELESQLNALAKSYTSQTNITQENNDMPFELNVEALKEM